MKCPASPACSGARIPALVSTLTLFFCSLHWLHFQHQPLLFPHQTCMNRNVPVTFPVSDAWRESCVRILETQPDLASPGPPFSAHFHNGYCQEHPNSYSMTQFSPHHPSWRQEKLFLHFGAWQQHLNCSTVGYYKLSEGHRGDNHFITAPTLHGNLAECSQWSTHSPVLLLFYLSLFLLFNPRKNRTKLSNTPTATRLTTNTRTAGF